MNWFQRSRRSARALLLLLCALGGLAWAQLAVPNLTGHVVDTTGTLSASAAAQLEAQLNTFEQQQGTQLVLLLVPTTQPEDIASYANRVANTWKIGRKEIGDGLLLVVATQDRKVRIEVAKTFEGAIPDLAAKRIIDESITPRFKQSDFAGGLSAGAEQLMALVRGEKLPPPQRAAKDSRQINTDFEWADLAVFLFLVVPVVAGTARRIFGAKAGAMATGVAAGGLALLFTASLVVAVLTAMVALILTLVMGTSGALGGSGWRGAGGSMGSGGWGSGGGFGGRGGSGGFGSGGGGDFGGGGASGDW
jgi:uncharacterized protein